MSSRSTALVFAAIGVLIAAEAAQARPHHYNPPGPVGGRGTNYNPPGPRGGPGTNYNPPGPVGGRGTNWVNPPGPRGGPGASRFDLGWRRTFIGGVVWVWHPQNNCWFHDNDQNPPGPRGGPGTNWENPPGPIGGPGASPDVSACK